jgi:anti-anti-sigma factor
MQARIDEDRGEDVAVARIDGEIDAANVRWVATRLRGLLTNHSHALVVDLTATAYIDSAGIAMLFELAEEMRMHQQQLRVVVPPRSPIARMLALTGVDRVVRTHAAPDEAAAGARASRPSPPA